MFDTLLTEPAFIEMVLPTVLLNVSPDMFMFPPFSKLIFLPSNVMLEFPNSPVPPVATVNTLPHPVEPVMDTDPPPAAPAPAGPVGPVTDAPVGPVEPVGPVTDAPVGPVEPVGPVRPVGPVGPVKPVEPVGPCPLMEVNAVPFQYTLIEVPAFSVMFDPNPDPDVYVIPMVKLEAVALANVQKIPGEDDVYVGRVSALNPVLVSVYNPAEFVAGSKTVGVGIINDVSVTVVMFVRHSVGPKMRKLAFGATCMLPIASTVKLPTDVTPADGPAA